MEEIKDWYIANTGYVLQLATPYYEELTVRENLTLAAKLRLPSSLSSFQLFERVERVMREVGGEGVRVCVCRKWRITFHFLAKAKFFVHQ